MEAADQEKKVDIADLQKEVIEMRKLIPDAYKSALENDFELFKKRLTNATTQKNLSMQCSQIETPTVDTSLLNDSALFRYNEEDLKQYIENVEQFAMKLRKDGEKKKK